MPSPWSDRSAKGQYNGWVARTGLSARVLRPTMLWPPGNLEGVPCLPGYNCCMTHDAQELLQKALTLPDKERAELAGNLLASLDVTVDLDAEAAWQEEITRRLREVES